MRWWITPPIVDRLVTVLANNPAAYDGAIVPSLSYSEGTLPVYDGQVKPGLARKIGDIVDGTSSTRYCWREIHDPGGGFNATTHVMQTAGLGTMQ